MLEVGALKPDNYSSCESWLETTCIDLRSNHPSIIERRRRVVRERSEPGIEAAVARSAARLVEDARVETRRRAYGSEASWLRARQRLLRVLRVLRTPRGALVVRSRHGHRVSMTWVLRGSHVRQARRIVADRL